MLPRPILALVTSAAAFAATSFAVCPAAAQTAPTSVAVAYGDLNLSSDAGRATFDSRIAYAARRLCGDYLHTELKWAALSRACQAEVIAGAQARRDAVLGGDTFAENRFLVSRAAS